MEKVVNAYNKLAESVNELAEFLQAIQMYPPQGEEAKKNVQKEMGTLFHKMEGETQSVKSKVFKYIQEV